uniref:helix-turn-helix domain-containing protein n=1 Tax=Mesorhizobium sp. L-2-11 TaxID=2744521 RepID=UPI00313D7234
MLLPSTWSRSSLRCWRLSRQRCSIRDLNRLKHRLMPNSLRSPRQRRLLEQLIAARKNKGLTQAKVTDALRRPQSFVARYEGGERRMDVIEFLDAAEALEIDPCEVLAHVRRLRDR